MSVEAKKLIDFTRLSRFKELMDQSVDGKLSRLKIDLVQIVSVLPELDAAEEGVLYLIPTKNDGEYGLYAKETVDGTAKFRKNSSLFISSDLDGFLLKADAEKKYISTASVADDTITLSRPDGSTVVITVNNVAHATKATNAGYTNWLRTSSHTDHLFHTEWDGTYFWTYVTAGDGGYRAVRVERSNSSGYADSAGPAGVIIPFAGTSVPTGYLLCNGAAVSRTYYANLFAAIGTLYGAGDGSTTFNLPDARDRVLQGASGWHSTGSYIAAGLPNITGTIGNGSGFYCYQTGVGAFSLDGPAGNVSPNASGGSYCYPNFNFSAQRSNALYGASWTVQSPAIATNFIIKY